MAKRLAIERITRQDGAAQAASGPTRSALPLAEEPMQRPKLVILTTRYLLSLAGSGYPIKETLERLRKRSGDETVVTSQVLEELERVCRKRDMDGEGSLLLTPQKLSEIKDAIYSGVLQLDKAEMNPEEERAVAEMESHGNACANKAELSLLALARQMISVYDSDVVRDFEAPARDPQEKAGEESREPSVEHLRGFSDAQVMQVFGKLGYQSKGGNGHWKMQHPVSGNTATIPKHREISPRTLNDILRQNGISRLVFLKAAQDAGLISNKRSREIFGEAEAGPGPKKDSESGQPAQSA